MYVHWQKLEIPLACRDQYVVAISRHIDLKETCIPNNLEYFGTDIVFAFLLQKQELTQKLIITYNLFLISSQLPALEKKNKFIFPFFSYKIRS